MEGAGCRQGDVARDDSRSGAAVHELVSLFHKVSHEEQ